MCVGGFSSPPATKKDGVADIPLRVWGGVDGCEPGVDSVDGVSAMTDGSQHAGRTTVRVTLGCISTLRTADCLLQQALGHLLHSSLVLTRLTIQLPLGH